MGKLLPLFPPHQHYISMFGGSATDILAKPPSKLETLNDLDGDVYNVFKVVQDIELCPKLIQRLEFTPRSQNFFCDALEVLQSSDSNSFDRAWAFLTVAHLGVCCTSPAASVPSNWSYTRKKRSTGWPHLPNTVSFVARRLRNVQISRWSWNEVLRRFDHPDAFFFADPPYYDDTLSSNNPLYRCGMSHDEHVALLDALNTMSGKAILCGYSNPLYNARLKDWRKVEFPCRAVMSFVKSKPKRKEVIWMNYDQEGDRL